MLIGDSVNEPDPPPGFSCLVSSKYYLKSCPIPSEPVLSEDWNLPAGFHRWFSHEGLPQYTTLYYADAIYRPNNLYTGGMYNGNYVVSVGVVPVRETYELENVLHKSMAYTPATKINFNFAIGSYKAYSTPGYPSTDEMVQAISDLGASVNPEVTVDLHVFDIKTPEIEIIEAYFRTPNSIIFGSGHGAVVGFDASGYGNPIEGYGLFISGANVSNFSSIIPAYIFTHCNVQSYMKGESLTESYLKAEKGPAVLFNLPGSYVSIYDSSYPLCPEEAKFWDDLFSGKTVGEVFYKAVYGAWQNPYHLFGDPSLVLFGN